MSFRAADVDWVDLAARVVLDDCRICLQRLEDADDHPNFRINWVAMCALLRVVGHVLDKVDRPRSGPNRKLQIATRWKVWNSSAPEHAIFRDFIDDERNALLKEYRFGYGEAEVQVVMQSVETGDTKVVTLDPGTYRPYRPYEPDAPFSGDDTRDVAAAAIDWWDKELTLIEQTMEVEPQS